MLLNSMFSPTGNHIIAVVKVSEEHESLANVIYDVNSLEKREGNQNRWTDDWP